jgi:hypothetical protein
MARRWLSLALVESVDSILAGIEIGASVLRSPIMIASVS